ncbi:MAG: hypothetical protein RJA70_3648 [Pseudomonadota bacterium]
MRLLFVSHSFAPPERPLANVGGMQRVAMDLHAQLQSEPQIELHSMLLHSSWRWIVPRAIPFITALLARVPAFVEKHRIEAVLFSSMTTALPAMGMADRIRDRGATVSAICHGLDVTERNTLYQAGVRRTLAALDAIFPVSRATGQECADRGAPTDRILVIPNGIHLERFEQVLKARLDQTPLPHDGLPDGAFLCLSVGRQVRRKGFAWFVTEVMPRLPTNVHYWLAGTGPEASAIAAAVVQAGLQDRVRVLGLVDDAELRRLYSRADLFVMPNIRVPGDMEGFGVVMLEAGACGVPTLASDLEGIADVITHGENGYLVASEDADAFVQQVSGLCREPDRLRALSQRSAALVRERFAWSSVAENYRTALLDVGPRRSRA